MTQAKETNLTKKILWLSNAPWLPSGYGNQTNLFLKTVVPLGHDVAVAANAGLRGTKMDIGVKIYPGGMDGFSNDVVHAYAHDHEADLIISLYDAWPLNFATFPIHDIPWVAWAPIDCETVPPAVAHSLRHAQGVVAFSKHAQRVLLNEAIEAEYIPHGIDTGIYCPGNQAESRGAMDLPADDFLIGMVANNAYYPSRKCIPQVMEAFARFHAIYPDSHLYLHCAMDESRKGVDILHLIGLYGLQDAVSLPNHFDFLMGYPFAAMANLYRSFDILANPSLGEGFGIPIMEAQACGTPVVATNGTAMTELVEGTGYLVEGDPWFTQQGAFQTIPSIDGIVDAFKTAYQEKKHSPDSWKNRKKACRTRALKYDFEKVVAPMWDKYLRAAPWKLTPNQLKKCACIDATAGNDEGRSMIPNDCPIHTEAWTDHGQGTDGLRKPTESPAMGKIDQ